MLKRSALPVVTSNLFGCALSLLGALCEGVRDNVVYVRSLHPAERGTGYYGCGNWRPASAGAGTL